MRKQESFYRFISPQLHAGFPITPRSLHHSPYNPASLGQDERGGNSTAFKQLGGKLSLTQGYQVTLCPAVPPLKSTCNHKGSYQRCDFALSSRLLFRCVYTEPFPTAQQACLPPAARSQSSLLGVTELSSLCCMTQGAQGEWTATVL